MDETEFALRKLKNLAQGKPKQVILSNAEKAGFSIKCIRCGSTLIAIFPCRTEDGEGVIFSCLKCDSVLAFGIDAEHPIVKANIAEVKKGGSGN